MSKFDEWWDGETNPALNMPESAQTQIKPFMRAAFNAGKEVWRKEPKQALPPVTRSEAVYGIDEHVG